MLEPGSMKADCALRLQGVAKHFALAGRQTLRAVDGVDLEVAPGETLALVGESGSGKSTLGRLALGLEYATAGTIEINGRDIASMSKGELRRQRAHAQMVFQDPWSSLNPRMSIGRLIEEPYILHTDLDGAARRLAVGRLAERVKLDRVLLGRYPNQLSGGQLQRVCVARAVATEPRLVVLDEPTSALDLSVRAEVLRLLIELQRQIQAAYLFITHDLSTVRAIADRIAVMYLGRIVEQGPTASILQAPAHPYTQALLSAQLPADPSIKLSRHILTGEMPSPIAMPSGCPFRTRCSVAMPKCGDRVPALVPIFQSSHMAACIRVDQ
jgi:oligopeptide/dipeptide ABC transporter ATP-binding protein